LAGTSSLFVISAIGYLVQSVKVSGEGLTHSFLFWLKYVAAPLAGGTLLGVLLSHGKNRPSTALQIIIVMVTPLVAFCTFLGTYLVSLTLYTQHYTPKVVDSILAIAHISAVVTVRWSVNLFHGTKKT
jgi:hypothetical protein